MNKIDIKQTVLLSLIVSFILEVFSIFKNSIQSVMISRLENNEGATSVIQLSSQVISLFVYGGLLMLFLGYTNIFKIPKEVKLFCQKFGIWIFFGSLVFVFILTMLSLKQ